MSMGLVGRGLALVWFGSMMAAAVLRAQGCPGEEAAEAPRESARQAELTVESNGTPQEVDDPGELAREPVEESGGESPTPANAAEVAGGAPEADSAGPSRTRPRESANRRTFLPATKAGPFLPPQEEAEAQNPWPEQRARQAAPVRQQQVAP